MNRRQRRSEKKSEKKKVSLPAKSSGPIQPKETRAEQLYRQILQDDLRDPFALHALGIVAHQSGRNDIAADLLARAIALNELVPEFHFNRAIALKALGRLEEAGAAYGQALFLKPDYAQAHNNLGNIRKAQGLWDEAIAGFEHALAHRPGYAEAHYNLGSVFFDAGRPDEAAMHLRAALAGDPDDSLGARLLLARLGESETPMQASKAHLEKLYATRSHTWDSERQYRGHALVAEALRKLAPRSSLDILDAGCGTGLVGPLLRDLAKRLDGVDFSAAMLARAREKRVYDNLYEAELVTFIAGAANTYDAIASAATLIHFGDLAPVFKAAAHALKDEGLFVFTLFPGDGESDFAPAPDAELTKGGCFVHTLRYVERLAEANGFAVVALSREIHEHDLKDMPVEGLVVALRRL